MTQFLYARTTPGQEPCMN